MSGVIDCGSGPSRYDGPDTMTGSVSGSCSDAAGNVGTASFAFKFDQTPPRIAITTPADEAVYQLNQAVGAVYGCSDNLSGVAACGEPAGNVAEVPTGVVGTQSFSITAVDLAGNSAAQANTYSVQYGFAGFFSPLGNPPVINLVNAGRTVPVKWRLGDAQGVLVTELSSFGSLVSSAMACDDSPVSVADEEEVIATASTALRYDPTAGQFIYNWQTMREWTGCRLLRLTLADGTHRDVKISFR